MRRRVAAALMLLPLAACGRGSAPDEAGAGTRLEAAATAAGMIADPAGSLTGSWALDTDRACIVPGQGGVSRVGLLVDYGEGQGCAASGTLQRSGGRLRLRLGDCRIEAAFDGERITLPVTVPAPCEALCAGRASLAALTVDRQSESPSEAATLRTPGGRFLCGG